MSNPTQTKPRDATLIALLAIILFMLCAGLGSVWLGPLEGSARLLKMFELGAAMLAASGAMLAAYVTWRQGLETAARDQEKQAYETKREQTNRDYDTKRDLEQRDREKLEETFRLIAKWDDPHFLAARKLSVDIGKKSQNLSPTELITTVESSEDLRSSVALMLNYFEIIRLSIKHNRIDVEIMRLQLGPVAKITLDRFDAWIKKQGNPYLADVEEFRRLIS